MCYLRHLVIGTVQWSCQSCSHAWLLYALFCLWYIFVIWYQTLIMRLLTALITVMEMCIITQPKVATEEIAFGSQISYKNKNPKTLQHSHGGSQYWSHNVPNWRCCFGTEKHHSHLSTFFFSLPSSSLLSSNLPAQPLRQQHFCMEQQLQHLCEGRPFDVLCVDNTQKCIT